MRGFKSFADKTVIEFKQGVTCVVGPNGSGKSNITDAVRWVLGEQRVKTLRGSKMEDVIFNGTKHRKSLGLAEVKLVFDNSEQFFPLEYEEISVTRRVHRSGESEYHINQMPCRLKDIRELFMDTGIGREGYSIIGQGRIDEVLSNNKDERRMLFEEAAGIVKYKHRKLETEKKLKNTSENLLRIQDILSEIEDRVAPLKAESERAKQYLELSEAVRSIELKAFAEKYDSCEQFILTLINQKNEADDFLKGLAEKKDMLSNRYTEKDQMLYTLNQKIRAYEEQLHDTSNRESRTLGEKQLIEEKIINFEANIKRLYEEIGEIEKDQEGNLKELDAVTKSLEHISLEKKRLENEMAEIFAEKESLQFALSSLKTQNDNERQEAFEILNKIEILTREIETLAHFKKQIQSRITESSLELEKLQKQVTDSNDSHSSNQEQLDQIQHAIDHLNQELSEKLKSLKYYKETYDAKNQILENQSLNQSKIQTEKQLLETMEEEFEGYDKGVREILTKLPNQDGIHGIVATLIEVPERYETAVEIALGRAIQNIVCEEVSDAKRSIDFLRKHNIGRVTFLPLENISEREPNRDAPESVRKMPGYIGLGCDLVKVDALYRPMVEHLLGRVIFVDTFEHASDMLKVKKMKFKLITLKGDVLVPGGHITGGAFKSRAHNMLGRKRRISELSKMLEQLALDIDHIKKDQNQLVILKTEDEVRVKAIREQLDALRMDGLKIQNQIDNQNQWRQSVEAQILKVKRDIESLEDEVIDSDAQTSEKQKQIIELENRSKALETTLVEENQTIETQEGSLQKLLDKLTKCKIDLASIDQNMAFKIRERARVEDDLKTIVQKLTLRNSQRSTYEDSKGAMANQVVKIVETIESIQRESHKIKSDIDLLIQEKKVCSARVTELTRELTAVSSEQDDVKDKLHKIDVRMAKLEVEKDVVVSELWDKYEMSIAEAMQVEHNHPASEVKQLKQALKLLGTVNLNAIKEYEEVSERYEFLTEQRADLTEAIQQLEKIIRDLDRKMIQLFKTNFEWIATHFKDTFSALFNGGMAELVLTDYDDLLNCDIEIIAQPPGKKLQSINLLSGGEKALTAIALLFAILKTKPSPFCILDEIEAALDDVNVYRFAAFIGEYARQSQFVVITHRKGTMEIADTLYGVTMEEYGISKVLSVRLEDVEEKFM